MGRGAERDRVIYRIYRRSYVHVMTLPHTGGVTMLEGLGGGGYSRSFCCMQFSPFIHCPSHAQRHHLCLSPLPPVFPPRTRRLTYIVWQRYTPAVERLWRWRRITNPTSSRRHCYTTECSCRAVGPWSRTAPPRSPSPFSITIDIAE